MISRSSVVALALAMVAAGTVAVTGQTTRQAPPPGQTLVPQQQYQDNTVGQLKADVAQLKAEIAKLKSDLAIVTKTAAEAAIWINDRGKPLALSYSTHKHNYVEATIANPFDATCNSLPCTFHTFGVMQTKSGMSGPPQN